MFDPGAPGRTSGMDGSVRWRLRRAPRDFDRLEQSGSEESVRRVLWKRLYRRYNPTRRIRPGGVFPDLLNDDDSFRSCDCLWELHGPGGLRPGRVVMEGNQARLRRTEYRRG